MQFLKVAVKNNFMKRDLNVVSLIYFGGILLRIVVFIFLHPFNPDGPGHLGYIKYIVENKALPVSGVNPQTYHPPLYYILASVFYHLTGEAKGVQIFSLFLSIGTFFIIKRIIFQAEIIRSRKAQLYSFAFAAILPQFVMFSLYVSNDSLAFFLGALICLQVIRVIKNTEQKTVLFLSVYLGAGLLTKASFLGYVPALLAIMIFLFLKNVKMWSLKKWIVTSLLFSILALGIGVEKYLDNYIHFGNAFYSSLDYLPEWTKEQKMTYRGLQSFIDIDLIKLLHSPFISAETSGSYPLLIYATLWYQHIAESNFVGNKHSPINYLGSVIYILALVPTMLIVAGMLSFVKEAVDKIGQKTRKKEYSIFLAEASAIILFSGNVFLIIFMVVQSKVWSILQARLFFPSFIGLLCLFGRGFELVEAREKILNWVEWTLIILFICFLLYFASEIGYQTLLRIDPNFKSIIKTFV